MTAFTIALQSATATALDPGMFYCIGRLKGIPPIARNRCDELLYKPLSEVALSMILASGPDGLVFQQGGECYISRGQQLEPFDSTRTDWTNQKQVQLSEEITAREWAETLKEVKRAALEDDLKYNKGDRHLL